MRTRALSLAAAALVLTLASCGNAVPEGPTTAGAPSPSTAPSPSDDVTPDGGDTTPEPSDTEPAPGSDGAWPVPAPADGSIRCEPIDAELEEAISAIDNVLAVTDASVFAEACSDKEGESMDPYASVDVEVEVAALDGADLVALNDAVYETLVAIVAPMIPYTTFLTVAFPDGSQFKVNGGSMALEPSFADEVVRVQEGDYPGIVQAYVPRVDDEPQFGQAAPGSVESRVVVDGESAADGAEMESLLEAAWGELVDVSSLPGSRYVMDIRVLSATRSGTEISMFGAFQIPTDLGAPPDPLWAEAAVTWVELARDGNPNSVSFGAFNGRANLGYRSEGLSAEDQERLDRLVEILEELELEVEIQTF